MPETFSVVPCTQQHIGEVFFAAAIWPATMAYPGDDAVSNLGTSRCESAFAAYDGVSAGQSAISYMFSAPDSANWSADDRTIVCIAYHSTDDYPYGAPSDHSIKGSRQ
jgi:hypothetical protein